MAGCFGNDPEDRARERQLNQATATSGDWVTCLGCKKQFEAEDIDEDGLCTTCDEEDDELEFAGEEEETGTE